jgi:hypothetical protein
VFVALDIQHAMRMRHIFICGESGCITLFHINGTGFEKKLLDIKCAVWFCLQLLCCTMYFFASGVTSETSLT